MIIGVDKAEGKDWFVKCVFKVALNGVITFESCQDIPITNKGDRMLIEIGQPSFYDNMRQLNECINF